MISYSLCAIKYSCHVRISSSHFLFDRLDLLDQNITNFLCINHNIKFLNHENKKISKATEFCFFQATNKTLEFPLNSRVLPFIFYFE